MSTKVHLVADRRARPIATHVTAGQRGDSPEFTVVLDKVSIARRGRGRPRRRPAVVMADKAYSSAGNRAWLRRHRIRAVIPVKSDQATHRRNRGSAGGRPPGFDPDAYKGRNVVERCIARLKQFRAVATRYDKRKRIYQGTLDVASFQIWLRDPPHDPQDTP